MHAYVVVVDVDAVRHQKINIGQSIKNVTHDEKKRQLVLLHFCRRDYVEMYCRYVFSNTNIPFSTNVTCIL